MTRVLVSGSRDFDDLFYLTDVLNVYVEEGSIIIHGGARGADTLTGLYANEKRYPVVVFPADWDKYGRKAGPIRNQQMLDEGKPDIVVAFPTKESIGTWDMIRRAEKAGIPVKVFPS